MNKGSVGDITFFVETLSTYVSITITLVGCAIIHSTHTTQHFYGIHIIGPLFNGNKPAIFHFYCGRQAQKYRSQASLFLMAIIGNWVGDRHIVQDLNYAFMF